MEAFWLMRPTVRHRCQSALSSIRARSSVASNFAPAWHLESIMG